MPIRKVYSPALIHQRQAAAKKKYFVSYCIMDGGLGFGHASLVLSELDANPNANVRVDSAYGFYSLAKTPVAKVFGFDPVSVGQIKKEDLRYFVTPDANYVYNFELTQEQMKELKARLETRMKLYNELIPNAKKIMKAKGLKGKVNYMQALHYIQENQDEFPEVKKLKPTDFKHYQVHKNNCVIQAQAILSSIGLECNDKLAKVTQQKFMSKKATKVKDMEKLHMAAIGGTTKSFFVPYSVFSVNPLRLIKNIVNKVKGTLPQGKQVEYKKWQTTSKDIDAAKEQYLKLEHVDLYAKGKKLLKKYKVDSYVKLVDVLARKSKVKEQEVKDIREILQIWQAIDSEELIKRNLLHVKAEAFWTERFKYFNRKGHQCDLWSNLPLRQIELMKQYCALIHTLKERIRTVVPNYKDNDMAMSFLDAGYLALSQVSMDYQKIENILQNLLDYHDNVLKDELKQDVLTDKERSTLEVDLSEIKTLGQKGGAKTYLKKM